MKTTLLLTLLTLWHSSNRRFFTALFLMAAWSGGSTAQAQTPVTVGVWGGDNPAGPAPMPLAAQSGVTAIAAGDGFNVALKQDGSVVVWGAAVPGLTNVPVAAQSGVTAITAGSRHIVTLKSDGSVVAWGDNASGQTNAPAGLSGVTAVAAGVGHTVALKSDGSVVAWGNNTSGQTTVPTGLSGVTAITAGANHTVVLVTVTAPAILTPPVNQSVNEWQSASLVVVATGFPVNYQWRKDGVDVAGATSASYDLPFAQTNQTGSYTVVVSNRAGSVTNASPAVLTVNAVALGAVVAWGDNTYAQTSVPVAAQSGVTAIAAGATHTLALKRDGSVVAWGDNSSGETNVPAGLSAVTAVAAGLYHSVALKSNGSVVAWGANYYGQTTVPTGLSGVTAIAAGQLHTVALKNNGTVVAWGNNRYGQVTGTPSDDPYPATATASPVTLGGQVLSGVIAIAAGGDHTVALRNDGTVVAWGRNNDGEVAGIRPTDEYFATVSPITLGGRVLSGVTAIAAGYNNTVALIGGVSLLPRLNARTSGHELILSWPTNAAGLTLQSTPNLTPPMTWTDSTQSPAVIGAHFTVTNAASIRAQFYRLNKP